MTKKRNRAFSVVLALALAFSLTIGTGMTAFAQEPEAPACTHTHDGDCEFVEFVEGAPCTFDPASHEHNEDCGYIAAVEGVPCTHSCELCEEETENDETPAAVTGIITEFVFPDAVQVEIGTSENEVPFPATVTATVQPDGEGTEAATVTVGVGAWNLYFGEYTPDVDSMCLYEADRDSLTLPEGVSLPEGAELPLVRVEVGEFKMDIAPMAAAITDGGMLTFNGTSLTAASANNLADFEAPTLADLDGDTYTWFVGTGTDGDSNTLYLNNFVYSSTVTNTTTNAGLMITTSPSTIQLSGNNSITTNSNGSASINGLVLSGVSLSIEEQITGSGASLAIVTGDITSTDGTRNNSGILGQSASTLSIAAKVTVAVGATARGDTLGLNVPTLTVSSGPVEITVGNADYAGKKSVGINTTSALNMNGGDLSVSAGSGAAGSYGIDANSGAINFFGGTITAQADGSGKAISTTTAIADTSFTGGATSSDSYALRFSTNTYVYTAGTVTDAPALYATNKPPVVPPTVNATEKEIYGNGTALVVVKGTTGTTVYIDANRNGVVDTGENSLKDEGGITDAPNNESDLSAWKIYGGGDFFNACTANTKITMLSGTVQSLFGGGKFTTVTGNTEVNLKGGTVSNLVFGGGNGAVGSGTGDVTGNTAVTMTGGTVGQFICGGGFGSVSGNGAVTITGGEVKQSVYGGNLGGDPLDGVSTVTLGGTAVVGSDSTADTPYGVVINDTDVENGVSSFVLSSPAAGASINVLLSSTPTDGTVIATGAASGNEKYLVLVGNGADGKIPYRDGTSIKVKAEDRILYFGQGNGFVSNSGWGLYTDGGLNTEYTGNVGKWAAADGVLTLKGFSHTTAGFMALYIKACNGLVLEAGTQNSLVSTYSGPYETCGLYYDAAKELAISGQGSLQATGGTTTGSSTNSCGIYSFDSDISIQGSNITATGGASKNGSVGVKAGKNALVLTIDGAAITATGGDGSGTSSNSYGVETGQMFIKNGGELYATSGEVTATAGSSCGVRSTGAVTVSDGRIIAKSGNAPTASAALYCSYDIKPATLSIKGRADADTGELSPLVRATDRMYRVSTVDGTIARYAEVRIAGAAPRITTTSLPNGAVGTAYSQTLAATGTAPITWALAGGTLPQGLTLGSDGTISGTPTAVGTSTFSVTARNAIGTTAAVQFTITITAEPAPAPAITGVSASPAMITQSGSKASVITVTGTGLPAGITVTAFDRATATNITGSTDASGNVTLTFPANTSTTDDKVYTIKASLDGGTTWAAATATVTVLKNAPTHADPAKDTITKGGGVSGSGTTADPFVVTGGNTFTITLKGDRQDAPGNVAGDTQLIPEKWSINPSGTFPYGGPYVISAKIDNPGNYTLTVVYRQYEWNGTNWQSTNVTDTKTASVRVDAKSSPTPAPEQPATTGGSPQTGDNSNMGMWLALLALSGGALGGGLLLMRKRRKADSAE